MENNFPMYVFILYMIATIDNLEENCQKYISGR